MGRTRWIFLLLVFLLKFTNAGRLWGCPATFHNQKKQAMNLDKIRINELEAAKQIAILRQQNEILSGAYETSQKRVKELEDENKVLLAAFANSSNREIDLTAEKEELFYALYRANAHLLAIVKTYGKAPLPIEFLEGQHREFSQLLEKYKR